MILMKDLKNYKITDYTDLINKIKKIAKKNNMKFEDLVSLLRNYINLLIL